ncbi:MAG TPA: TetR family transcriptional regulator [Candidatus Limnocylindrales bacterium]
MTRPRGRPLATDRDAIAVTAFRLFRERGFDATTMDDVARAAGIGRSTLFRYFPSKGAILWMRQDETTAEFVAAMRRQPLDRPPAVAVFDAYTEMASTRSADNAFAKEILHVIVTTPAGSTGKWDAFDAWAHHIAAFVAERRGGRPDDQDNASIGLMIWAALWTALEHWALSDEPNPDAHLALGAGLLLEGSGR